MRRFPTLTLCVLLFSASALAERTFPDGGKIFYEHCLDYEKSSSNVMSILMDQIQYAAPREKTFKFDTEQECYDASQILATMECVSVNRRGSLYLADSLKPIADLKLVTNLSVDAYMLENEGAASPIGQIGQLESLTIWSAWSVYDLGFLKGNDKLQDLYFDGPRSKNEEDALERVEERPIDISAIANLRELETVILNGYGLETSPALEAIKRLPKLKCLKVNDKVLFGREDPDTL